MFQLLMVVLYFVFVVCVGVFTTKKKVKNDKEFYGRSLGLVMCVAVGAGEWLGGTATTGTSEYGYLYGISGAWYTIANGLGICFLAIFFAKMFRSLNTVTVPEIIYKFIGEKARVVSGVLLILVMMIVGVSQMIAIGTIGESLLGLNASVSILILGLGVLLYTSLGGMKAVGNTNLINLVVMYLGVILAVILCGSQLAKTGGISNSVSSDYFSFTTIGFPKISSWLIASVLGACTAQAGLQPILVSKDKKTARKASFLIALLVAPFGILTALLGVFAKASFPALADAKLALPTLIMTLPPWASGIFMAAMLAAILSTASPIFLACGTLFTRDVYSVVSKRDAGEEGGSENEKGQDYLKVSKAATLVSGLICIFAAILARDATTVLDIVYFAYSMRGCLFVVLLLGIFWKKFNQKGAIWAMVVTCAVSFFWVIYTAIVGNYPIPNVSETYAAVVATFLSAVIATLVARKFGKNSKVLSGDTEELKNAQEDLLVNEEKD